MLNITLFYIDDIIDLKLTDQVVTFDVVSESTINSNLVYTIYIKYIQHNQEKYLNISNNGYIEFLLF